MNVMKSKSTAFLLIPKGRTDKQKSNEPKFTMTWIDPDKRTYTLINQPIIDKFKKLK